MGACASSGSKEASQGSKYAVDSVADKPLKQNEIPAIPGSSTPIASTPAQLAAAAPQPPAQPIPPQLAPQSLPPSAADRSSQATKLQPVSKLRTDCKVHDVYKLGRVLGNGGFSVVKLAVEKATGKEYACKIMALPSLEPERSPDPAKAKDMDIPCEMKREDIFKEIDILCSLNHENILYLKEYFEEQNKVFLIMELLTGGELFDAVIKRGSYNEAEARTCFRQLLCGIEHMHSRGVCHRDLKLENLLLKTVGDLTVVKIADFGLAKRAVGEAMHTICGTPQYVAPEVIQGLKDTEYGPVVDMWAAGIVLFILLGGYPPFYSESEPELFKQIRKGHFSFNDPAWDGISFSAKDLISKLLVLDPLKRLTASQALQHRWLMEPGPGAPVLSGTQANLKKHFSKNKGMAGSELAVPV